MRKGMHGRMGMDGRTGGSVGSVARGQGTVLAGEVSL